MKHWHSVIVLAASLLCAAGRVAAGQDAPPTASGPKRDPQASPPGWSETLKKTLDLELEGRQAEIVPIYEKWVADYPNFAGAHDMLAGAHEQLGRLALRSHAPDAATTHFEMAAAEMRRSLELTLRSEPLQSSPLRGLIELYGPLEFNRPAEYERLVGEALARYPADPFAHAFAITLLARKGEPIDGAVRAARAAIPKTSPARTELAGVLMGFVRDDAESVGVPVAAAALVVVNDAVTLDPTDIKALEQKAEILRTQARRASEPERTKLFAEEARVRARVAELRRRTDRIRS